MQEHIISACHYIGWQVAQYGHAAIYLRVEEPVWRASISYYGWQGLAVRGAHQGEIGDAERTAFEAGRELGERVLAVFGELGLEAWQVGCSLARCTWLRHSDERAVAFVRARHWLWSLPVDGQREAERWLDQPEIGVRAEYRLARAAEEAAAYAHAVERHRGVERERPLTGLEQVALREGYEAAARSPAAVIAWREALTGRPSKMSVGWPEPDQEAYHWAAARAVHLLAGGTP